MKITLINTNNYKKPWPVMPIGLCMVAAALEGEGHEVNFVDLCFSKKPLQTIEEAFQNDTPDCVGIGIRNIDNCVGHNPEFLLGDTKKMIDQCKKMYKGPIILGGAAVSINTEEILEFLDLNFASCGDGEAVMNEVANRLENGQSFEGVRGLTIRENGSIIQQAEHVFDTDVNTLNMCKPHRYIDIDGYAQFDLPIQIQTKRGCALKCNYCPNRFIEGGNYRLMDPQKIADHIEILVKETGIKRIEFVDSTFNIPLSHSKDVLRAIIDKNLDIGLNALGLHPNGIDEEFVELMDQAGFEVATVGIDAASDTTLKDMHKGFRQEKIIKIKELLKRKSFPIAWYLLMGTKAESYRTVMESLEFMSKNADPWDCVFIAVGLRIYKGSPLADRILDEKPESVKNGFLSPAVVHPILDIDSIKIVTKHYAISQPNFVIYNDEKTPEVMHKMGFAFVRRFAPKMPVWRIIIFFETINKFTGVLLIKRLFYSLFHFRTLRNAKHSELGLERLETAQ